MPTNNMHMTTQMEDHILPVKQLATHKVSARLSTYQWRQEINAGCFGFYILSLAIYSF